MILISPGSFEQAIYELDFQMLYTSEKVHTSRWQGVDISKRPEAEMRELAFVSFGCPMMGEELDPYREAIKPNLPWADDHFEQERVSGEPINPGTTWKSWPFGHSAAGHLDEHGQFNHSYAERYWPKRAGQSPGGRLTPEYVGLFKEPEGLLRGLPEHHGIRHPYGDLAGVVRHLVKDPLTRQAYLPVWFPEDTGDAHDGRKPCTLGYHFMLRQSKLHVAYYIRSCDLVRHFRDDIYLTVRLVLWVLGECRKQDRLWRRVSPGDFLMHISSLHCFINDFHNLNLQFKKE